MIFWILLGIAVLATLLFTYIGWDEDGVLGAIPNGLIAAILSGAAGVLIMLLLSIWFGPTMQLTGQNDHRLVALQTSSSVEGRSYFLGSGYINGVRTLNYITDDEGAFRVESAEANNAVVYQDSEKPNVTVYEYRQFNPWFAPFDFGGAQTYDFHVPAGSILSDYTIDNG